MRPSHGLAISLWVALSACTHELQIVNLRDYVVTSSVGNREIRPRIAIRPFTGKPEDRFYHFAVAQQVRFDASYEVVESETGADIVLSIEPTVRYRSSAWNMLIMFPGFLAFAPAWSGYVYRADIETRYEITGGAGNEIGGEGVPVEYSIRHADVDRTAFANLGWFPFLQAVPLAGGIYDAIVFDDAITDSVQNAVRENYGRYVYRQISATLARVPR